MRARNKERSAPNRQRIVDMRHEGTSAAICDALAVAAIIDCWIAHTRENPFVAPRLEQRS
jgi:hypothetical protein